MRQRQLLLHLVFNDSKGEGRELMKRLLNRSEGVELVTFANWKRIRKIGRSVFKELDAPFNLAEALVNRANRQVWECSPLRLRYRPAPCSEVWSTIGIPDLQNLPPRQSLATARLLMSMMSLEHASRSFEAKSSGVMQALLCSASGRFEPASICDAVLQLSPELMSKRLWGVANVVPFREITADQEWEIAGSIALHANLATMFDNQWNQFLFASPSARPPALPHTSVSKIEGLSIYELEKPTWAEACR